MMTEKLRIDFGIVEHGWYPINVYGGDVHLVIDASDVPIDPLEQLVEAVVKCFVDNQASEAWMHLEPNYYKWCFAPHDGAVELKIFYVAEVPSVAMPGTMEEQESVAFRYEGQAHEMLLSIWRSLERLSSQMIGFEDEIAQIGSKVAEIT
jgi:hypothetical protein